MFGFIKKIFLTGLTVLSYLNLLSATSLRCISVNNQECKVRPEIVLLVLKQVNAVVAVTISMIHMQKCVFLML